MKRYRNILIGVAISLFFLCVFLRKVDPGEVWEGIKGSSLSLISLSILVGLSQNVFRCIRWRYLLMPIKNRIGFYNLISTTIIGYMVSWIIPGRIGELVRPVLLGQREGISKSSAVATIVIERLMDGMTVVFLFGISLLVFQGTFSTQSKELLKAASYGGILFTLFSIALFLLLILLVWKKDRIMIFVEEREKRSSNVILNKILMMMRSFIEGASVLKEIRIIFISLTYSFVIWLIIGAGIWLSLKATHLSIPIIGIFTLLPLLVLGISIPTPGGVGTYHEAMQIGLMGFFEVSRDAATSTAIVVHGITIIPVILLGLAFLWIDGLTLRSVSRIGLSDNQERKPV
ncbi:MAG: lysylphosphatidylglycerol synthase transmembrane domain-containing protein [Acidobacteriota bacterium]